MIRILNAEPLNYSPKAIALLETIGQVDLIDLTRNELIDILSDYQVLIVRLRNQIDKEVIDSGHSLKVIVSSTTGLDHIDVQYAESRGIKILSLTGQTDFLRTIPATAEHTWALLLSLIRRVPWAFNSVLGGNWERDKFRGHDLADRQLGILGLGRIGEMVAEYGKAFGMQVGAYDPFRGDWVTQVRRFATLHELLQWSNVLSIHVPFNSNTKNLIGAHELKHLPKGAIVINTARGAIFDEYALIEALQSGHLSGAALDVVSQERVPDLQCSAILNYARAHENLLVTPHIGGATFESMSHTELFMAQSLCAWFGTKSSID